MILETKITSMIPTQTKIGIVDIEKSFTCFLQPSMGFNVIFLAPIVIGDPYIVLLKGDIVLGMFCVNTEEEIDLIKYDLHNRSYEITSGSFIKFQNFKNDNLCLEKKFQDLLEKLLSIYKDHLI